jgi:hypothetical protein
MAKWKELSDIGIPISTPSPEAIVRAALERAAEVPYSYKNAPPQEDYDRGWTNCAWLVTHVVRNLASDPAEVAAIIKKAGEDRG